MCAGYPAGRSALAQLYLVLMRFGDRGQKWLLCVNRGAIARHHAEYKHTQDFITRQIHSNIYSSLILFFFLPTPPCHPSLMELSETQTQLDLLHLPHLLSPATSNAFFPLGCLPRQRYQPLPPSLPPSSVLE